MSSIKWQIVLKDGASARLRAMNDGLEDFSEAFTAMLENWARHNVEKFDKAAGMESIGVAQAADEFWSPLSSGFGSFSTLEKRAYFQWGQTSQLTPYQKRKRREGYEDWLMVRTGALSLSLEEPSYVEQDIEAKTAAFGLPTGQEARDHADWNWNRRQTIFLDESDKLDVQKEVHDLLTYGPGYKDSKNQAALDKQEITDFLEDLDQ